MNALMLLRLLDAGLAINGALMSAGINYREVMDAQEKAQAEGRELSQAEREVFIDQAQAALDQL